MDINTIKNVATCGISRGGLVLQKYSPQILTGAGVVGVVASSVMTARATLKLEPILAQAEDDVNVIRDKHKTNPDMTDSEYARKLGKVYFKRTAEVAKLYGPGVLVGVASVGCLLGAQGVLHKRNVALTAAYKGLETSFVEYRKRVVDKFDELEMDGKDLDRDFLYGFNTETKEVDGKEVQVKTRTGELASDYARFFDEYNKNWNKNAEYNLMFLKNAQNHANDILKSRGHIFLNDVYDMIGIERSRAGQIVGWILDGDGDNYVDFNIYDLHNEAKRAFVNGVERSILLDFNVDGIIYDRI